MNYYVDKLWPAFVTIPLAVLVTQWAAQKLFEVRRPKLEMIPEESILPGIWRRLDNSSINRPYHAWRIKVQHTKIPWFLASLIKGREPALQCKAHLIFCDSEGAQKFIMQGRWAYTPEPSLVYNPQEKITYPDTIDIGYHDEDPTILDCIVKFDDEKVSYAWNNESYAFDGKTPGRNFEGGTYKVEVKLSGPNIRGFTTKFNIVVSEDWEKTSLALAGKETGPVEYREGIKMPKQKLPKTADEKPGWWQRLGWKIILPIIGVLAGWLCSHIYYVKAKQDLLNRITWCL